MVACGGRPSTFLKSLTVSPTAADGQVQFRASGTRVNGSQLSSVAVLWWNSPPWTTNPTPLGITIDENGNATCPTNPVITGRFPVWATAPVDPNTPVSQMTAMTPQVVGTAQLTCP
jgi:hypothetical protein